MKSQNIKKVLKVIPATFVLSSALLVTPGSSFAATTPTTSQVSADNTKLTGLLGYYFTDENLKNLAFMTNRQNGDLSTLPPEVKSLMEAPDTKVLSAFWKGQIQANESGEYSFTASNSGKVIIQVNGQQVFYNGKDTKIHLEKGKLYPIEIVNINKEARFKQADLKLSWTTPSNKTEQIPDKQFFLPEFKKTALKEPGKPGSLTQTKLADPVVDRDSDGIPDALEIGGYTVDVKNQNLTVVPWVDSVHVKKGLTKYYSSPSKWSTASDPYSDFQKVTGFIDKQVKAEARNPLVAAYPVVKVDMEQFVLSKLQNVSLTDAGSRSNTVSKSTSNSNTESIGISVGAEVSASLFDLGVKVSTSLSYENSSTISIEESNSHTAESSWSKTIGLNEGEAAYLTAGIRYYNKGTAPIYRVAPTNTLVLGKDQSLVTVKAKENQFANVLTPDSQYPAKGQAPITLNRQDDFGSSPITMNLNQVEILEKEKKLRIDTDQVSGNFAVNVNGRIVPDGEWSDYMPQIQATTARIILEDDQEGTSIERRIAAPDSQDPVEKTKPEITLKEALKLASPNITEKDGTLYYKEKKLVDNFEVVVDENTAKNMSKQIDAMKTKDIYQFKLAAKMNIGLRHSVLKSVDDLFGNFRGKKILKSNPTRAMLDTLRATEVKLNGASMSKGLREMQQQRLNIADKILKDAIGNIEDVGLYYYGPRFRGTSGNDLYIKLYLGNLAHQGSKFGTLGVSNREVSGETVTHILRDANDNVIKEWKGVSESAPDQERNINDYLIKNGANGCYYTVKLLDGTEYVILTYKLDK
ncbi:binary toxin-like calcium binding domain-containing protein [Bacillus mycoides]|uniref:binary toxin-like calcium binding domain-containing protein n=1 Tax=Bacillus mycoides TaxID=1405 RepID=UPI003D658D5F